MICLRIISSTIKIPMDPRIRIFLIFKIGQPFELAVDFKPKLSYNSEAKPNIHTLAYIPVCIRAHSLLSGQLRRVLSRFCQESLRNHIEHRGFSS